MSTGDNSGWSQGLEIAFYVTICITGILSAVASAWIAWQCRNIDTKYSDFGMSDAMMLRVHVFWMSLCNFLYILHYVKFIPSLLYPNDAYQSGHGKNACIFIAMYSEFFLVATISWYFCITILLAQNYLNQRPIPYYIQNIAVLSVSLLFTFIPFAMESNIDHIFGPSSVDGTPRKGGDGEILDCNLLAAVELPHDILLTFYLICSVITMILGFAKLREIIFLSRDFQFIAKLVAFTFVFVLTYIWRPLIYYSSISSHNWAIFLQNAFLAFSGVGNWLVWVPQIQFQVRETTDLSAYFSQRHSRLSIDETLSNRRISRSVRIKRNRQESPSIQRPGRRYSWSAGNRAQFENVAGSSCGSIRDDFFTASSHATSAQSSNRGDSNEHKNIPVNLAMLDDDQPQKTPRTLSHHARSLSANSDLNTFFGWSLNSNESLLERIVEKTPQIGHRRASSEQRQRLHSLERCVRKKLLSKNSKLMTPFLLVFYYGVSELESEKRAGSLKLLDDDFLSTSPKPGMKIFEAEQQSPPEEPVSILNQDKDDEYSPPRIINLVTKV